MTITVNDRITALENKIELLANFLDTDTNITIASGCIQMEITQSEGVHTYFGVNRYIKEDNFLTFTHMIRYDKKSFSIAKAIKKYDGLTSKEIISKLEEEGEYVLISEEINKNTIAAVEMLGKFEYRYNENDLVDFKLDTTKLNEKTDSGSNVVPLKPVGPNERE